ncbi:MAG TPA: NAD(P)-binding domain-containing protein [Acidimicrobiales bacterium]|nr:NAD(P)-binding domain-containing protein [Acidimicrobiales bacterium]
MLNTRQPFGGPVGWDTDTVRPDHRITAVIIGAGHSGLAMSKRLADGAVDHIVLERDEVASSWLNQRWDSFTLLTPNWQTRLPGCGYEGDEPDGFMTGAEIAAFIQHYAGTVRAPVRTGTAVTSVRAADEGYDVVTTEGTWRCRCVALAGGACNVPSIPPFADAVPEAVATVNPLRYGNPDQLPEGGVLVVGAAATGIQLAEEIQSSGRQVYLSVGEHVRMPRTYRGRDIQHWMETIGRLDDRYDEVEEILKARGVASPQLVGTPERRTLDLNCLTGAGVQLRGRLGAIRDGVALFSGGLRNHCRLADQKLGRLLDEIDEWIGANGLDGEVGPSERPEETQVPSSAPLTLDLTSGEVGSVVWATGFRPDLSWVDLPVFDSSGRLRHDGGVVDAPGVYYLGAPFLRRRRSSFIHGAAADTTDLAEHLATHLAGQG